MMDKLTKVSIWTNGGGRIYEEFDPSVLTMYEAENILSEYEKYTASPTMSTQNFPYKITKNLIINFKEVAGIMISEGHTAKKSTGNYYE